MYVNKQTERQLEEAICGQSIEIKELCIAVVCRSLGSRHGIVFVRH
jgi:hypothetical protein